MAFYIDVRHEGLGKYRRISGADQYVVEQRAQSQKAIWDEQWRSHCGKEKIRSDRAARLFGKEAKKSEADILTKDAQDDLIKASKILAAGSLDTAIDWKSLENRLKFSEREPTSPRRESSPPKPSLRAPLRSDAEFTPKKSIWCWIFPSLKIGYEQVAEAAYLAAHEEHLISQDRALKDWTTKIASIDENHLKALAVYESQLSGWQKRMEDFESAKNADNQKLSAFKDRYSAKNKEAVLEYIDIVLSRSTYPDYFPKQWQLSLLPETGVLLVDYELPSAESLPSLKAVKYVQSKDVFESSYLRESEVSQLYDGAMYQTCLRTLREIFISDVAGAIESVTFNGWVNFTDKATGNPSRACIMSLQAKKAEFLQINLAAVDPKACFRALKGVGSAKLAGMSAVAPILRFNKNDERFVAARDVIDDVSETTNVAAIPWEDFEHLVRDVFEKEFSATGGEVKITRASRDHGVDAIAFDPDPIRGGKIVIQAKRYTNVVGVAAVRDLYGTLINEGATKGILVTTSQYGSDSYDFAKGKPITLLDGGNLLSLLAKHGHRARIDLAEAKKLGALREEL